MDSRGLIVIAGLVAFSPVQAQNCSNATYSGAYSYLLNGTVTAPPSTVLQYAQLGKLTSDGNGSVFGQAMESKGGLISRLVLTGTYTVNADCSATQILKVTPQSASPYTLATNLQFVEGGAQALMATSTTGTVLTGEVFRSAAIGGNPCGTTSLSGSYGLVGLESPLGSLAASSNLGGLTFDGKGGITFKLSVNDAAPITGAGSYSVAGDCSGTAILTLGPGNVINDAFDVVAGGNILLIETDPGSLFTGVMQPQSVQSVLPQFVFGGGWYSALYFSNGTAGVVSIPVTFSADDGTPLVGPALNGMPVTLTMLPKGSAIFEAPNSGSLLQGYASVNLPAGVSAYGVFRQSAPGAQDQEAVVPLSAANSSSSTLAFDDTNYVTSVAIVNPGPNTATITVTLWDNNGNQIGSSLVALAAHHKTETMLRSLPGLSAIAGQRGTAQFTSPVGGVAVLGLRFNGLAFTSIPATQQ